MSENLAETMWICALRFDGYKYEQSVGDMSQDSSGEVLSNYSEAIVKTLRLHEDELKNFGAFFILQRFLHKWGGETLTKHSQEHLAYDFLFLHLYKRDVPELYVEPARNRKWAKLGSVRIEEAAEFVRVSFQRKGQGSRAVNL